eukprot:15199225-Heterocapsa_arctica.AAC.1
MSAMLEVCGWHEALSAFPDASNLTKDDLLKYADQIKEAKLSECGQFADQSAFRWEPGINAKLNNGQIL